MVKKLEKLKTVEFHALRGKLQSGALLAMKTQDVKVNSSDQFNNAKTMNQLAEWAAETVKKKGFEFEECYADEKLKLNRVVSIGFNVGDDLSGMSYTFPVKLQDANKTLDAI